jgi:4-amino-4-deoxy-L-arabinose transferase-like glycosyltransferase
MAGFALLPTLFSLDNELPEVDPAQYADVAARIVRTGEWFALRDTFGPHINKPPLMMWLQALCMLLFGVDSVGARLPAVLLAALSAWGVFKIGVELKSRTLGTAAACLFGAQVATQHMVLDPKVDLALTATTTWAIWAVLAARTRPRLIWVAWAFAGLAVLSKGPLGLGIIVLALAPEALRPGFRPGTPDASFLKRVLALKPLRGVLVLAAVAAPFYVGMSLANGPRAAFHLLFEQGFGRVLGKTDWVGNTTPLFFLHTALWAYLPTSGLVVLGLWRRARGGGQTGVERVPLWWFFVPLLVLSIPSYKLPQHIYALSPAIALLGAQELLAITDAAHHRWRAVFSVVAFAAAAAGVLIFKFVFPRPTVIVGLWAFALLALPALAVWLARRLPSVESTALHAVAALAGFWMFFHAGLQPAVMEYQPSQEIGALVRKEDTRSTFLPYVGTTSGSAASFYALRDASGAELSELRGYLESGQSSMAVVSDDNVEVLEREGFEVQQYARFPFFPVAKPTRAFLNPATRAETLEWQNVVRLTLK